MEQTQNHMQGLKAEIEQCGIQAEQLNTNLIKPTLNNQDRALEIAKMEAFNLWLSKEATTN